MPLPSFLARTLAELRAPKALFWLAFVLIGGSGLALVGSFGLFRSAPPFPAAPPAPVTSSTLQRAPVIADDATSASLGPSRVASAAMSSTTTTLITSASPAEFDPATETQFASLTKPAPTVLKRRTDDFERGLASAGEITETFARLEAERIKPGSEKYATLGAYLAAELGGKFHRRHEWAGRSDAYDPKTEGRRKWEPIGRVEFVTIHHADGVPEEHPARMIRNIFVGHTDPWGRLGGADVGYHFFVDRDGNVWEGRDARKLGTHVGARPKGRNNEGNLGICGLGSFTGSSPPKAMREMCTRLPVLIARYYGRPLTVRGHRDWIGIHQFNPSGGTDCPGKLSGAVLQARVDMRATFAGKKSGTGGQSVASAEPKSKGRESATGDSSKSGKPSTKTATKRKEKS